MKLGDIARLLSCTLEGDGEGIEIVGVATLEGATDGYLSFFTNPKYQAQAMATKASAVITGLETTGLERPTLRHENPYLTFARALEIFHAKRPTEHSIHPTAWIADSAVVSDGVSIGAFCYVGQKAVIRRGAQLGISCVVETGATVGEDSILHSGSIVKEGVTIGNRCVLHNNAVVGSSGFGYARTEEGRWYAIPQTGTVVLEDEVDVGACSAIDRAALGETRVGRGTKIDNQVHIGHGCSIGPDNLICAQVGLAGSTRTGEKVILAGQVGAAGHLEIGDRVIATAQAGIPGSIAADRYISGSPAVDHRVWLKASAAYSRLPEILRSLRELEHRISQLETYINTRESP
jgi:UDP-3-O-[3-hydroxymyristoyl] glucosamine N-acyltransferase